MDEQTVYTEEPVTCAPAPEQDAARVAPVSTAAFFGYKVLYGIPVIGWILCLVFSFTQKNVNKRNFARATLIGLVISLVITCVIGFAAIKVAEIVIEKYMMEALGGSLGGLGDLGAVTDVLDELQDGKYDDVIQRIEDGEFGEHPELSGLMDDLRDGGIMAVVDQFQSGGFEDVAENYANGEYDELLQKAADGELGDLGALGDLLNSLKEGDMSGLPGDLSGITDDMSGVAGGVNP